MSKPVMICDFCGEPNPPHACKCRTCKIDAVALPHLNITSTEDWMACDMCKLLIDSGQRAELRRWSLVQYLAHHESSPDAIPTLERTILDSHTAFWENKL
jgi:hypothetical protein